MMNSIMHSINYIKFILENKNLFQSTKLFLHFYHVFFFYLSIYVDLVVLNGPKKIYISSPRLDFDVANKLFDKFFTL